MSNIELIKEWFFWFKKPIGSVYKVIPDMVAYMQRVDKLYQIGTFRHESLLPMKKAYLGRFIVGKSAKIKRI